MSNQPGQPVSQVPFRKGFRVGSLDQARYVAEMIEKSKQKAMNDMVDKKTNAVKNAFPSRNTSAFLPTELNNNAMLEVQSRQSFLDQIFGFWFNEKKFKAFAIMAAVLAVYTFFIHPIISGFFAMVAGFYYMKNAHMNFVLENMVKKRTLMHTL